jgi:hypothetical protein
MDINETWKIIEDSANEALTQCPSWRRGQALFNALYSDDYIVADKIRGTKYDCFHRDNRIEDFKMRVIELWKEEQSS